MWSAGYGLPDVYHSDEPRIVERAVQFHTGDLNPRFFNWPTLYMYVVSAVYGVLFAGAAGGVVDAFARDPGTFYLVGRLLTAVLGTATVAVLYRLGRDAYGTPVGLLAALFLAVDLLHIRDSHWVTTDVPVTLLILLTTAGALRYWRDGRRRSAVATGLAAGLATSMKYPGALAFLALLVAHAAREPARPRWSWRRIVGTDTVAAAGAAVVGFLIGTPFALLTPVAFVRGVLDEVREVNTVQFGNAADAPGFAFHLLHSLPVAMGWPLCLLALAGVAWALARRGAREVLLLAFPLQYFVVIGTWSSRFERYVIPLLPYLAVLAAAALAAAARWADTRRPGWLAAPARLGVVGAVVAALVLPEVGRAVAYHRLLAEPDTRVLGAAWVEREVPYGTRIALEPYSVALPVTHRQVAAAPALLAPTLQRPLPTGVPGGRRAPGDDDGYWLVRLGAYDLDGLRRQGVTYVVLSSFIYQRHLQACPAHPDACRFYAALDAGARLVFVASPGVEERGLRMGDIYSPLTRLRERRHPGPSIRIYRLAEGVSG